MRVSTASFIAAVVVGFVSTEVTAMHVKANLRLGADEENSESLSFWMRELQASGQVESPDVVEPNVAASATSQGNSRSDQLCRDTGGKLTVKGTCGGPSDPFPTDCLATGEEGGPYDCAPSSGDSTPVCECNENDCWVKNVGCVPNGKAGGCLHDNGVIELTECCEGISAFPDTCAIGACGCESGDDTAVCNCPGNKCWDGSKCVENDN